MSAAAILAFLSGYIALSYEILWYRALSFMSEGRADTFALLLGAYLTGLALGALWVRRACGPERVPAGPLSTLFRFTLAANLLGFSVVPALGWLATRGCPWTVGLAGVGVAAGGLGAVFPLVAHVWIPPDSRTGLRVSYVYLANILGSTAGSLLTGFVLCDVLGLGAMHVLLALLGLGTCLLIQVWGRGISPRAPLVLVAGLSAALALFGMEAFGAIYEKLQLKRAFDPAAPFAHVVETRSGVITVNAEGQIFGGGIYDGAFNTSMADDKNAIVRCYALAELHRAPREALMIGLSSGSWASVIAAHPGLERLTVVEINPGYLQLIPLYPEVAGLLKNPKVQIEIDDGRRWLVRNRGRKFDLIVANATFHWRSHATNLLSREFLSIVRDHLKEGGIYYYNTTGSERVLKTGASVYRYALKVMHFLAVSDSPIQLDPARLRESLFRYPRGNGVVLNPSSAADQAVATEAVARLASAIEPREVFLPRADRSGEIITDDNMGTEWERR